MIKEMRCLRNSMGFGLSFLLVLATSLDLQGQSASTTASVSGGDSSTRPSFSRFDLRTAGELARFVSLIEVSDRQRFGKDKTITIGSFNAGAIGERLAGLVLPMRVTPGHDYVATIAVKNINSTNQFKECDFVLFGGEDRSRAREFLPALARVGILSFGIHPGFIADGGCVVLRNPESEIPTHYDRTAFRKLGLRLHLKADENLVPLDFTPADPIDPASIEKRVLLEVKARRDDTVNNKTEILLGSSLALGVLKYVVWPEKGRPGEGQLLKFGFRGSETRFSGLKDVLSRRSSLDGLEVEWIRNPTVEEATNCHALYLTADHRGTVPHLLEETRGKPILTIVGDKSFLQQGGLLSIAPERGKMKMRHNPAVLRDSGIQFEDQLMRLMVTNRTVVPPPTPPPFQVHSKLDDERRRRLLEVLKKRRLRQNEPAAEVAPKAGRANARNP